MPRNRMVLQIDDELVLAKHALAFWREQKTILADTHLREHAATMVRLREAEIQQMIAVRESLQGATQD
jgi:hypothetical protein